jgi:hypothetical protein
MTPQSDVDILVTPFVMAAEVEDAVGRQVDFLIRADVEAMKNIEARDSINTRYSGDTLCLVERNFRLTHIAEAAALIARCVECISKRASLEDTLRHDSVIRRIQDNN